MGKVTTLMDPVRKRYARPLSVAATGAVFLVSQACIAGILHAGDAALTLLRLQTTFDPAAFKTVISSLSPEQLAALLGHFRFDFLHPLWYGAFSLLLLAWLFERNHLPGSWNVPLWGAPLMAMLDVLENLVHLPLIAGSLEATALPVAFAATCASLKWCLAAAVFLLSGALICRLAVAGSPPESA